MAQEQRVKRILLEKKEEINERRLEAKKRRVNSLEKKRSELEGKSRDLREKMKQDMEDYRKMIDEIDEVRAAAGKEGRRRGSRVSSHKERGRKIQGREIHNPPKKTNSSSDSHTSTTHNNYRLDVRAGSSSDSTGAEHHCKNCGSQFEPDSELASHIYERHQERNLELKEGSQNKKKRSDSEYGDDDDHDDADDHDDETFKELINKFSPIINMPHRRGKIQDEYNFSLTNTTFSMQILEDQLLHIFREQGNIFKLNLSLGFALVNIEGDMRYFYAHNNETVFETPVVISNMSDLKRVIDKLRAMDIIETMFKQRPSTKWRVYCVTNIRWVVTRMNYPLGSRVDLPGYIKKSRSIISLTNDQNSGRQFNDNLCLFRCLAYDRVRDVKKIEKTARQLFADYTGGTIPPTQYVGTPLSELGKVEKHFAVNINVLRLSEEGEVSYVWRTPSRYDHSMNLNIFEELLSFISKMDSYSRKYKCNTCEKLFNTANNLRRHERSCENVTKLIYPGGYHCVMPTVFEELENYGYDVDNEHRFYPYFVTYDFEAMLVESDQYLQEHVPVSCSISSNVPGYENPVCIVEANNADSLVDKFVEYIGEIQSVARENLYDRYRYIIDSVEMELMNDHDDGGDNDDGDNDDIKDKHRLKELRRVGEKLELYISQIPVIGFNSQKYDVNLIKTRLARALQLVCSKENFVVKKVNQYMCIATEQFRFLDISNFIAAGSSYDSFIRAYHPEGTRKGYFCYEFLDSPEKLDYPRLPPYESFYSNLKQLNVLEEELAIYDAMLQDGYSHREAIKEMNLSQKPMSGKEKYSKLESLWVREDMKTFKDYLIFYNNLDVEPFRDAVQKLLDYYSTEQVDVFKSTMSVPGVARQLLFRSLKGRAHFSLFHEKDKDIHQMIQKNIVVGPSIVFTRYHENCKTRIRGGEKLCQCVLGLDANALYLGCLAEHMPTGYCSVRRAENDFALERRDRYLKAFKWLDWISKQENINIKHALNSNREFRIGPYRVDGFDSRSQTVFEFDGCFYHSHSCIRNPNLVLLRKRKKHSEKRRRYITSRGYTMRHIWECKFDKMLRENPVLKSHCDSYHRMSEKMKNMTPNQILQYILRDELFGAVEVDISVPDHLSEKFSEMSPIFGNTDVSLDDIGEYMQDVATQLDVPKKPRRLLIGAMAARKILIATPLLKWYLEHGLLVTRVYTVLEFSPDSCFKDFTEKISDARHAGDRDQSLSVISETSKLTGNASYGSMLMRKDRHTNTRYLDSESKVYDVVNSKLFRTLQELGYGQYEIQSAKPRIRMDIPIQIGYFILQYAKLRMLSFYYDCLDKYLLREDFELIEMDTDSYYMAISSGNLEELVRPDMANDFAEEKNHWFPDQSSPENKAYTRRTPGLFKEEMRGDAMVALCSKTYCVEHVSETKNQSTESTEDTNENKLF